MALLEHGAHIDSVNAAGQTPLSAATTGVAEIILKSQADMSLQCLAAQSIRKYNINYVGQVMLIHLLNSANPRFQIDNLSPLWPMSIKFDI